MLVGGSVIVLSMHSVDTLQGVFGLQACVGGGGGGCGVLLHFDDCSSAVSSFCRLVWTICTDSFVLALC
jgi:hypothetical protein